MDSEPGYCQLRGCAVLDTSAPLLVPSVLDWRLGHGGDWPGGDARLSDMTAGAPLNKKL